MTVSRRKRLALVVVTATAAVVAALCGVTAPNAQAFYIQNHEMITRNALPPDQVDQAALFQILVGPPPGAGAVGSDAFYDDDFRHIDNAKDPTDDLRPHNGGLESLLPAHSGRGAGNGSRRR